MRHQKMMLALYVGRKQGLGNYYVPFIKSAICSFFLLYSIFKIF